MKLEVYKLKDIKNILPRDKHKITEIEIMEKIVLPQNCGDLFSELIFLKEIRGLSKLDTSNVKKMSYMFCGCSSLTSLDLSSFDTSNVTDMMFMFGSCYSLTSLDLSGFDTSNVTNMSCMFFGCDYLL